MINKLSFPTILLVFLLIVSYESKADVSVDSALPSLFEDAASPFTTATIATGIGVAGDFQLIVCSVNGDGNIFSAPTPGTWTQHDNASCDVGFSSEECSQGIWSRFTTNPNSEDITCGWTDGTINFTGGSFRYSGVDTVNPVIDVSCSSGFSSEAIAPDIITEAGSQVVRVFTTTYMDFVPPPFAGNTNAITDYFLAETFADFTTALGTFAETNLFPTSGSTGEAIFQIGVNEAAWRACTIAIRMAGPTQETLTLNKTGNGTGTVTDPTNQIDCNTQCNSDMGNFDFNTIVTLTAIPANDSNFGGWGGDCSIAGLNPIATVTIDQSRSCIADFMLMAPPTFQPTQGPIPPDENVGIPTLSQWGHLSLSILALLIGVWFLRRHRVKS